MPTKKTAKKSTRTVRPAQKRNHRLDDHSFMIIVGGGFIILIIIVLLFNGQEALQKLAMYQTMTSNQKMMQKEQTISIKDFAFNPQSLTVKVGTAVTWMNDDTVDHAVVAEDGSFDTKTLAPGEKASYTFTKAGTFTYTCGTHPSMSGTVIVEE